MSVVDYFISLWFCICRIFRRICLVISRYIFAGGIMMMDNWVIIFIGLFISIIAIAAYFYIRYPFWAHQPILHSYDIFRRRCSEPFYINRGLPQKTKYFSPMLVETLKYHLLSDQIKEDITDFIRCNYIVSDRIIVDITSLEMDAIMSGGDNPSWISIYTGGLPMHMSVSISNPASSVNRIHPLGCIISRPIDLFFLRKGNSNYAPGYIFNYTCVNRTSLPDPNIARRLMNTHEYRQQRTIPSANISVFKKTINLCSGIIPLTEYDTHIFNLTDIQAPILKNGLSITRIYKDDVSSLITSLEAVSRLSGDISFVISSPSENIIAMVRAEIIIVFALKRGMDILGLYFFRDTHTQYEDSDGSVVEFSASFINTRSISSFCAGFLHALCGIKKLTGRRGTHGVQRPPYKILLFEDIGDNRQLLYTLQAISRSTSSYRSAYYLLNFVHPCMPITPSKCFVLY